MTTHNVSKNLLPNTHKQFVKSLNHQFQYQKLMTVLLDRSLNTAKKMAIEKERKIDDESKARKSKPTDQEFPPSERVHKQKKPIVKTKKAKSHKAIK